MRRQKKISVKAIPVRTVDKGVYAIYFRITYDRKSTRFSAESTFEADSFEHAKKHVEGVNNNDRGFKTLHRSKLWVERILNYEIIRSRGEYDVKGIGDRMKAYQDVLINYLVWRLVVSLITKAKELGLEEVTNTFSILEYSSIFGEAVFLDLLERILTLSKEELELMVDTKYLNILVSTGALFLFLRSYSGTVEPYEKAVVYTNVERGSGYENVSKQKKSLLSIGDWVINDAGFKDSFRKYLNEVNIIEALDEYTDNKFSKLLESRIYPLPINRQIILISIDTLVDELIRSKGSREDINV